MFGGFSCLKVISYTLRDIKDEESYMESMGQARTSEVLRDARIGNTEYQRIKFMRNLSKINESLMNSL
jgi:hypothetical protein